MSPDLWLILSFAVLLALGVPVAFALGLSGAIGIIAGLSPDMLATLGTNTYNGVAKYPLIAIPLFILTGLVFEKAGVALRLVRFAQAVIGPRHGGLAMVAVLVCLIMGGMSGSGPADAAAVAMVMLPSMTKAGYPKPFSATLIAASASTVPITSRWGSSASRMCIRASASTPAASHSSGPNAADSISARVSGRIGVVMARL